jgi:hypothetical protein
MIRAPFLAAALTTALSLVVFAQTVAPPRIWTDGALDEWATPIAALNIRPAHVAEAEYYAVRGDNLRTYPVYHPDAEPAGYWEALNNRKPEPLVDVASIRTRGDWIRAGERAFREADSFWSRTNDPAVIAQARNPRSFENVLKLPDGSAYGPRWVVTDRGVMLSYIACANCHLSNRRDGTIGVAGPRGPRPPESPVLNPRVPGAQGSPPVLQRYFVGDSMATIVSRMFGTPWAPDDRIQRLQNAAPEELRLLANGDPGVFNRPHGSPFYATKIPDLQNLRYSRYLDATATHRLRGPEDVARYAAFITGADPMKFGSYHILSDEQRQLRFRYADEVLFSIGVYLMSLEPPRNPDTAPPERLAAGERVFQREGCVNCHTPPGYTNGKLTPADGWQPPPSHPNRGDILPLSVGTDPGLALRTRKGTGLYKIPSLRGVWYRPRLLHDGSLASLEEMFDAARLSDDYRSKGWNPPGTTTRAIHGHTFGLELDPDDRAELLAFLRSL